MKNKGFNICMESKIIIINVNYYIDYIRNNYNLKNYKKLVAADIRCLQNASIGNIVSLLDKEYLMNLNIDNDWFDDKGYSINEILDAIKLVSSFFCICDDKIREYNIIKATEKYANLNINDNIHLLVEIYRGQNYWHHYNIENDLYDNEDWGD